MSIDYPFRYRASGLTIQSRIALPELIPLSSDDTLPDVSIRYGASPHGLPGAHVVEPLYQIAPDALMYTPLDRVVRYRIEGGKKIIIRPGADETTGDDFDPETVRAFLLTSAWASLLHQRRGFPVRGCALAWNDGAIVIAGDSGAGVSTLAMALLQIGCRLIADGVVALDEVDGAIVAQPFAPRLKLLPPVLEYYAIDRAALPRIRPGIEAYSLDVRALFADRALPVRAVFWLSSGGGGEYLCQPVPQVRRLPLLLHALWHEKFAAHMGILGAYWKRAAKLAELPVYDLVRSQRQTDLDALAAFVKAQFP